MGKILHFNHDARRLLQAGVDELADAVKVLDNGRLQGRGILVPA